MNTIEYNGKTYALKLGVKGCRFVEKALGKSVFEALGAKADGSTGLPTIGDLSVVFRGALLNGEPDATQELADQIMDDFLDKPENDFEALIGLLYGSLNFIKAPTKEEPKPEVTATIY